MQTESSAPYAAEFAVLDSVITAIARTRRMRREDAEDLRQTVHLRLAERDFDVFRRFDGRSSLRTYLIVVVSRMLLDAWDREFGKWRPSAVARRHGRAAVVLERLVQRDGYSVDEAIQYLRATGNDVDATALQHTAAALPLRRRALYAATVKTEPVTECDQLEQMEREEEIARYRAALARVLARLAREDRQMIWLRYHRKLTIPAIAERLHVAPKLLYRRMEKLLTSLRHGLRAEGISSAMTLDL